MDFAAPRFRPPAWLAVVLAIPAVGALFGAYVVVAPTHVAYRLDADHVVAEANLGVLDASRTFVRTDVHDARAVTLTGGRRTNGTARPGYCEGRFAYAGLGSVWQATSCAREAVAFDAGETIVITPADRDGFLAALRSPGSTGEFPAAPAPSEGGALWIVALLSVSVVPFFGWFLWLLSRPMSYRVEGGALIVPAHLRPVRVRLAGAVATRQPIGNVWRVAGSAMPGFALGLFRGPDGNLHAAATRTEDGVMIRGERAVFVSPEDIPGFLAALQDAGATVR